jgi:hypothetical protein
VRLTLTYGLESILFNTTHTIYLVYLQSFHFCFFHTTTIVTNFPWTKLCAIIQNMYVVLAYHSNSNLCLPSNYGFSSENNATHFHLITKEMSILLHSLIEFLSKRHTKWEEPITLGQKLVP